ncbi:MAG: beta-L-arabinofuranosidase domain-containing protein [Fimbriimonadaceae bacterium]
MSQTTPLAPSPFQKLPAGAVQGRGWLLMQLKLQRDGFAGKLSGISGFLNERDNAWLGNSANPRAGWEELPYWLKGQVSLAYVLNDQKLKDECQVWIEGILASQKEDGWFGPEANRKTRLGTPDLWPNMLAQSVLQTYYEATGDQRVILLMQKYADWLISLPEDQTVDPRHYWHYYRVGDQIASLLWLHNNTHDPKLIKLAEKMHRHSAKWVDQVVNRHGVNFAQGFREPALYSLFSKSPKDYAATERNWKSFMTEYGLPGGMYAADENARPGKNDPRQATESCSVAEMMLSHELLMQTTGKAVWGDRAEEVAFNWLPTTMTADLKALRYLTCANMAVSDAAGHSPGIENGGPMFLFDPHDHRCCQHNVGMAWPYFTEHLWLATDGNGLAAAMYSPSIVTAKVGDGTKVTIEEKTNYPFEEDINFLINPAKPVKFPLTLRVPGWAQTPVISVNGKNVSLKPKDGYVRLLNTWKRGDKVTLKLPMMARANPGRNHAGSLIVSRGPLVYSLKIDEESKPFGHLESWPSFEVRAKSEWNFGLPSSPTLKVVTNKLLGGKQPWESRNVPIQIETQGRRIPEWGTDLNGLVAPLQKMPALSNEPKQKMTLIPMGAARLRMTQFPTVSTTGTQWKKPRVGATPIPATYSHRNWWDTESALSDKLVPSNSADEEIPRFTWWDHKGTTEWVQYTFKEMRTFQKCRVYWFSDEPNGGVRMPESWKLQVKVGDVWADVQSDGPYPLIKDGWSEVSFRPIGGTQIRLVAKLKEGFSAGVLEWEVN